MPNRDHLLSRVGLKRWPPGFFTGQAGCFCCAATVTYAYHTMFGNSAGGVGITNCQKWTSSWTSMTSAGTGFFARACGYLEDGTAYFGYGFKAGVGWNNGAEKYVSGTDTWTALTAGPSPNRSDCGAAAVVDVYAIGGADAFGAPLRDNDAYNIVGDSWASKTDIPTPPRRYPSCFADGTYSYIACGIDTTGAGDSQQLDRYDPSGNSWTNKTSAPSPARHGAGAYMLGGKAYITGGLSTSVGVDNDEYDPSGDSWTSRADMTGTARQWHAAASVAASSAGWITGGESSGSTRVTDHDEYTYDSWTNRTSLPSTARHQASGASC